MKFFLPITDLLEMQKQIQVMRSAKTKRCLSETSSFSSAECDVVLSALLSSLDLLFLLRQGKRMREKTRWEDCFILRNDGNANKPTLIYTSEEGIFWGCVF